MINQTTYRLDRYRITQYGDGQLWWETHAALGEERGGKCFIHGNVLIIGQCSHEESGFLIGEFLDHLDKCPAWSRTRYYCFSNELLDAATCQNLADDLLEQRLANLKGESPYAGNGKFQLCQYQITAADGEIAWRACGDSNRIAGGQCIIESDMLFIGPGEYDEEGLGKQKFANELSRLPKWDKTAVWSRDLALRPCRQEQTAEKPYTAVIHRGMRSGQPFEKKPATASPSKKQYKDVYNRYKEIFFGQLPVVARWISRLWHGMRKGTPCLKYLIPLIVTGFMLALVMTLYAVKKGFHEDHRLKGHHHEHDDHER